MWQTVRQVSVGVDHRVIIRASGILISPNAHTGEVPVSGAVEGIQLAVALDGIVPVGVGLAAFSDINRLVHAQARGGGKNRGVLIVVEVVEIQSQSFEVTQVVPLMPAGRATDQPVGIGAVNRRGEICNISLRLRPGRTCGAIVAQRPLHTPVNFIHQINGKNRGVAFVSLNHRDQSVGLVSVSLSRIGKPVLPPVVQGDIQLDAVIGGQLDAIVHIRPEQRRHPRDIVVGVNGVNPCRLD